MVIKSLFIFNLCSYHSYFISNFLMTFIARFCVRVIFFLILILNPYPNQWYLFPYSFFLKYLFLPFFSPTLKLFTYLFGGEIPMA